MGVLGVAAGTRPGGGAQEPILAQAAHPARRAQIHFVMPMAGLVANRWSGAARRPIVAHRLRKPLAPGTLVNPSASPRHPWKALAVVLAMFALVHGARAHVGSHEHGRTQVHVVHASPPDADCPDVDIDLDEDDADEPDVATFIDDDDADWT
jgi:hypothetical protein